MTMLDFLFRRVSPVTLRSGVTVYLQGLSLGQVIETNAMDPSRRVAYMVQQSLCDKDGNLLLPQGEMSRDPLGNLIYPEGNPLDQLVRDLDGAVASEIVGHLMGLDASDPLSDLPVNSPGNEE